MPLQHLKAGVERILMQAVARARPAHIRQKGRRLGDAFHDDIASLDEDDDRRGETLGFAVAHAQGTRMSRPCSEAL